MVVAINPTRGLGRALPELLVTGQLVQVFVGATLARSGPHVAEEFVEKAAYALEVGRAPLRRRPFISWLFNMDRATSRGLLP